MLAAYMAAVVYLVEQFGPPVDYLLETLQAPAPLGAIFIALLVSTPESIGAVKAALDNQMQRAVNIFLGSVLATIGLTIPSVLVVNHLIERPTVLGVEHTDLVLLILTLALVSSPLRAAGRTCCKASSTCCCSRPIFCLFFSRRCRRTTLRAPLFGVELSSWWPPEPQARLAGDGLACACVCVTAAPTSRGVRSRNVHASEKRGMHEWIYVMLYAVSAKLIPDRVPEFHMRLTDGSIASQRPDGAEIVAAMKRARAAPDGMVRWTETCFCPTPLQHERATVLDRYFTGIETNVIDIPETFDGVPLMDRLAER
jgi:hypothetical protein